MSHKKVSDVACLIAEYEAGASSYQLAEKYATTPQTILNWLKKAGCDLRPLADSQKLRFQKFGHPRTGAKHSRTTRRKMRENHADVSGKNNPNFGRGLHGELNPNWNGGVTAESNNGRNTAEHFAWKAFVLFKDRRTCQLCRTKVRRKLTVHHIRNWRTFPDLRFEVDNGITLCHHCHGKVSRNEEKYIPLFNELVKLRNTV